MKRIIPFGHDVILEHIDKNSIVIDATVGNGNDTLFLAKHAKQVFGFLHSSNQGASWSGNYPWNEEIDDAVKVNSSLFVGL